MFHSVGLWTPYLVPISADSNACHRACAYVVIQTIQKRVVCIVFQGTVAVKRVEHNPDFGASYDIVILRQRAKTIHIH